MSLDAAKAYPPRHGPSPNIASAAVWKKAIRHCILTTITLQERFADGYVLDAISASGYCVIVLMA